MPKIIAPIPGERFTGTMYRVETGYRQRNSTAWDIVQYEQEEMGNDIGFPEEFIELAKRTQASECIWMTISRKAALRYSEDRGRDIQTFDVRNELCIGEDGDEGYLMLFD